MTGATSWSSTRREECTPLANAFSAFPPPKSAPALPTFLGITCQQSIRSEPPLSRHNVPNSARTRPGGNPQSPTQPVSAFEEAGILDSSDSKAARQIVPDQGTGDVSEGQLEKNAGSEEPDQISEPRPSPEPRPSIPPVHTETTEGQSSLRTEAKSPRATGTVRNLFRAVMNALTRSEPAPQPQKEKRKDETARGFKAAATALFRRIAGFPVFHGLHHDWDAFTWLKIWEYDNPESMDCHQDTVKSTNSDFSPHP